MIFDQRYAGPLLIACAAVFVVLLLPPVVQEPSYHGFADQRWFCGIPRYLDVITNLPFLLVGIAGLASIMSARIAPARRSWTAFFSAVALVGIGSAFYHLDPSDETLVWDRLPMTTAFAAVLVAVLTERLSERLERYALVPLVIAGMLSILWWTRTGDLRLYVLLQFLPLVMLPAVVLLVPGRKSDAFCIAGAVAAYVLAKVLEVNDQSIYVATRNAISGHSLKHIAAAAGCGMLVVKHMLVERKGQVVAGKETTVTARVCA